MPSPGSAAARSPFRHADHHGTYALALAIPCDKEPQFEYCIIDLGVHPGRASEDRAGPALKKMLVAPDQETLALAIALAWLLLIQLLVLLAWEAEMLTRQGALLHWLVVGALPPAFALWSLPNTR